jgi:hypothetical protein
MVPDRSGGVQRVVLLREVAETQPVSAYNPSAVRALVPGEQPQQCGLARAVRAEDHQPAAPVDGEVDAVEDAQIAVRLGQRDRAEWHASARGRFGQPDPGDLLRPPDRFQSGEQAVGAAVHVPGGHGRRHVRAHLVGLRVQRRRLAFGVGALPGPASLVGVAPGEVGRPAGVVDVERGAVRVQVEDAVDHVGQQGGVVTDENEPCLTARQEPAQPGDRVGVQMVRRLVEEQGAVVREQDAGEFDPSSLPAGQGADGLVHHPGRQTESGGDPGRLGLGRVPAARLELGLGARVGVHRTVGSVGHRGLGRPQGSYGTVEAPGRQDPRGHRDRGVRRGRVLGEVTDRPGTGDGTGGGTPQPREGAQEGGLAGTVTADQADAVAGGDGEGDAGKQQTRADAHIDTANGDHGKTLQKSIGSRTHGWRGSGSWSEETRGVDMPAG